MNSLRLALLAAALTPAMTIASAAVYKCTDSTGKVAFQSLPCKDGTTGDKVEVKPAPAIKNINPVDLDWVNKTKPAFISSCTQGLAVANAQRAGSLLNAEQIRQICECTTRRYYGETPLATLRGYDAKGDYASMQKIATPITQECGEQTLKIGLPTPAEPSVEEESILRTLH